MQKVIKVRKILKTMLGDITPKSFKAMWEGIAITVILIAILSFVMTVFFGIAIGFALLLALPVDIVLLGMLLTIGLALWISSAAERS